MMVTPHAVTQHIGLGRVLSVFLMAYSALFSIVNPFGAALIFAEATAGRERREVIALARSVGFYSFVMLMMSIWSGGWILGFFGISIAALQVSGGLVVAARAWDLLQAPDENEARKERQALQDGKTAIAPDLGALAFFPLTMPFTVGPGAISVAIALSSSRPASDPLPGYFAGLTLANLAIAATVTAVYSYAERIVSMLGATGTRIVGRLAALILLCIGIQILFSGIQGFVLDISRALPSAADGRVP